MASGGLGNLTVDLLLETAQWVAGLNKAEYQAQQFADAIEKKFNKMAGSVGDALKGMAAGFIAGFAVDRLVAFGNEVQQTADKLDKLAQKTGSSVDFMAKMSVQAEMGGVALDSMAQGFVKFNKAATEAFANEKSQPGKVFAALGVAVVDSAGKMRDSEAIYKDAAVAMGKLEDSAIKTAAAQILWGKSGADMIPVFNAMANTGKEAQEVLDNYGKQMKELAPFAAAFNDALSLLQTTSKTLGAMLAKEFLPYFTTLIQQFTDVKRGAEGLSGAFAFFANMVKGVIIFIDLLVTGISLLIKGIYAAVKALVDLNTLNFKEAKKTISEYFAEAGDSLKNFGQRVGALVDPMSTLTTEVKKQDKASRDLANAVGKMPPFKFGDVSVKDVAASLNALAARSLKSINEGIKDVNENTKELQESVKAWGEFHAVTFEVEKDLARIGKSSSEIKRLELIDQIEEKGAKAKASVEQIANEVERLNRAWADKKAAEDYLAFLSTIEGAWHDAFNAMFDSTKGGWEGMLDSMKASFKKILLNYIYEAIAKPLVLNLVTGGNTPSGMLNLSGTNSIIDQFLGGSGGTSSAVGKIVDYFSGSTAAGTAGVDYPSAAAELAQYGGTGSTVGGGSGAGVGAYGAALYGVAGGVFGHYAAGAYGAGNRGVQNATNYGATGAMVGSYFGPIGAIAGALIGTIVGISTDPDPDAMRRATFGQPKSDTPSLWRGSSKLGEFGFTGGQWLSDSDMGEEVTKFLKGISDVDNALASFMTDDQIARVKENLAKASKEYELGMEHGGIANLGNILRDRLVIISKEFSEGLSEFVASFEGPADDLVKIVGAYAELTSATDFDPAKIVEAVEAQKSQMEQYQLGSDALNQYIANMDTSAESMSGLVLGLQSFQEATVQMVLAIDQAAKSMHEMFTTTADSIRESLMSPEEMYQYLQDQTDQLYAQLLTETDPQKIQELAGKINENINKAWGLLDDTQQSALGDEYLQRIETLDQTVADKMSALRDVVIEDSDTMMESITTRLETLFAKGETTAQTEETAANTFQRAANTLAQGIPVFVAPDAAVNGG